MRANHNYVAKRFPQEKVVSKVPKILKWEQITTGFKRTLNSWGCFQGSKDTKMRANHNAIFIAMILLLVVSKVPKILKWEQITTYRHRSIHIWSCFQGSKDTKMRANHNGQVYWNAWKRVVSKVPKILKWEQITTDCSFAICIFSCFQGSKDTKMRANHNKWIWEKKGIRLFPRFQRY